MAQLNYVQSRVSPQMPLTHCLSETQSRLWEGPQLMNIAPWEHYALHVCRLYEKCRVTILNVVSLKFFEDLLRIMTKIPLRIPLGWACVHFSESLREQTWERTSGDRGQFVVWLAFLVWRCVSRHCRTPWRRTRTRMLGGRARRGGGSCSIDAWFLVIYLTNCPEEKR